MSAAVTRLVSEQRKRCLATILGAAEQSAWWSRLTREERVAYRERVILALGVFYDLVRDVVKVTDDDSLRNEHVIGLIERMHSQITQVSRRL